MILSREDAEVIFDAYLEAMLINIRVEAEKRREGTISEMMKEANGE